MSLDPILTTRAIESSYIRYLSTTFRLRDEDLQGQFEAELSELGKLIKGPILEATPPFVTGASVDDLVGEGLLSSHFRELETEMLPLDRPLYLHQEQAIRKSIAAHRNVVVASGTGSGKTETFLIPIINHLFAEEDTQGLTPGVRALLLYPMNALANDQVARLRELLRNTPEITFGRYTGETEEKTAAALEKYNRTFGRVPLPNELVSREQMRTSPPHILLTNYAMLEYLLLRPADNVFFDGEHSRHWRFLVIDEAHTYSGAKGIEMAMLLRRLKDRVVEGERGRLRCFVTSATLGSGEGAGVDVATFASQLFDEWVEWIDGDPARQDVVEATRVSLTETKSAQWSGGPGLYMRWAEVMRDAPVTQAEASILSACEEFGIPEEVLARARGGDLPRDSAGLLYEMLVTNADLIAVRQALQKEPRFLDDLAEEVFGEVEHARDGIVALVEVSIQAKRSKEDQSLLPARYHLFVRAIEGAYASLIPRRTLYLERRETGDASEGANPVFELAVCRQCGVGYLVGELDESQSPPVLRQPGKNSYENPANLAFFLLADGSERVQDDEDELVGYGKDSDLAAHDTYALCGACAAIDRGNLVSPLCDCGEQYHLELMHVDSKLGRVHSCPACGSRSPTGLVSRFFTGNDATASVLATALYQQIPPRREDKGDTPADDPEDLWSSTEGASTANARRSRRKGEGRQLLIFSDSRQDAAFFAPYLERTYSQILRRRLILDVLHTNAKSVLANRWRVQDLVVPLQRLAGDLGLFSELSLQEQEGEVWKWILFELLALDRRNSLEGLGLLGFSLVRPQAWAPPQPLLDLGLAEEEVWRLFETLLSSLRYQGAVLFPDTVSPADEFFSPRNREYFIRENGSNARRHILSWTPSSKGAMNFRLDFLLRLLDAGLQSEAQRSEAVGLLSKLWSRSLALDDPSSCWHDYFSSLSLANEGVVYRIKPTVWQLLPATIDEGIDWFHCSVCNRLTTKNIRGVCPTYRCSGRLQPADPHSVFQDNHYRQMYTSLRPIELEAREHTAQLSSEAAAHLQTQFVDGRVNALSCSTTFELGVDVGQLETVFMRNVPPSAANYLQRAGRAGRRTTATAFALTFAQRRPHDLTHFNDPMRMVTGEIRAPHFKLANDKVVRRHVYATALALFWKHHPELFGQVASFFFKDGNKGPELVTQYLDRKPTELRRSLERIVPPELKDEFDIENWAWVSDLVDEPAGALNEAADRVQGDVGRLEQARSLLIEQGRPSDFILRVINTIKRTPLISFLSSQNVIPKYGFPVDVVSLQVLHHADEARGLELDRDLRIALSEYAPSGEVVAGGKLWTSRYIKRLPDRGWRRYLYAVCDNCSRYHSVLSEGADHGFTNCEGCGEPLAGKNRGTFIVPEFGFITQTKPPKKPGNSRPERTYASRTYFRGHPSEDIQATLRLNGTRITATAASNGELAVINHAGYRGFLVCQHCGYSQLGGEKVESPHKTPWWTECDGQLHRIFLGHEFKTDILQLQFDGYSNPDRSFWLSLLYGVLGGVSEALDIDRLDLDGCLYSPAGDPTRPALVLYDDVPGGAGHVRRVAADENVLLQVLKTTHQQMGQCACGGELRDTSCYGCLRNYRNQFCHDELKRGPIMTFLEEELRIATT